MKHKCLDHVTTLLGLDEQTIEEDFKAVDTDEDGKVTLEEGLKVYEYLRETVGTFSIRICVYACCSTSNDKSCRKFEQAPKQYYCEAKFEQHIEPNPEEVCTLTAATGFCFFFGVLQILRKGLGMTCLMPRLKYH